MRCYQCPLLKKLFGSFSDRELKKINPITKQVLALEEKYAAMPDADLQAQTAVFKQQLADGKTTDDILPDAFAVCREAAWRVLGMKHFPVQVIGGIALHRGDISEMQTGEGKTLVATLPAYLNALTGEGVHMSPSTITWPSATASGWASSTAGWAFRRPDRTGHGRRCPPRRLCCRHHLRHQQRVRLSTTCATTW